MNVAKGNKLVCCILASILLFLGIGVALSTNNSSFLRAEKSNISTHTQASIYSAGHNIEETVVCTLSMLNDGSSVIRTSVTGSIMRWQDREFLMFLVVGVSLLYLFYYQSAESKEDGQLFLCRSAIVDYIHLKDSGE